MSPSGKPVPQSQPRTYSLSFKAVLSLPFRLCNPPPAVGRVRSLSVTPILDVRLDDVLDRKHLPPLGLKDFEEWLLYVEGCPENLYFVLWLKEYTVKHRQLHAADSRQRHRSEWRASQLAMFFAKARQTFFTPNADYELDFASDVLAPFHATTANAASLPDPSAFDAIAIGTRQRLAESLDRFVAAQFNNVGTNRALCGMVAGLFCCSVGALVPLVYNIAMGRSRWLRLTAFPGLWLGVTLLLASFHGVCLGVYIFGDLRQLRKFELTRPAISRPRPYSLSKPPTKPAVDVQDQKSADLAIPVAQAISERPSHLSISIPHAPRSRFSPPSSESGHSDDDDLSDASCSGSEGMIHISQAYYDDEYVEGPATITTPIEVNKLPFPAPGQVSPAPSSLEAYKDAGFGATAGFIHPYAYDPSDESDEDLLCATKGKRRVLPEERQRVSSFDFEALPPPPPPPPPPASPYSQRSGHSQYSRKQHTKPKSSKEYVVGALIVPEPETLAGHWLSPATVLRRIQSRCNLRGWRVTGDMADVESLESAERGKWNARHHVDLQLQTPPQSPIREKERRGSKATIRYSISAPTQTAVSPTARRMSETCPLPSSPNPHSYQSPFSLSQYQFPPPQHTPSQHQQLLAPRENEKASDSAAEKKAASGESFRTQLRSVLAVPAFSVPLTRVLSPVVVRGQWEIVVRSVAWAFLICWAVLGCLLAVPEKGAR